MRLKHLFLIVFLSVSSCTESTYAVGEYQWVVPNVLVRRVADNAYIPAKVVNPDWVATQAWVAAGNVILDPPVSINDYTATFYPLNDDTVIASLKAMNSTQFDAWWTANVTNLAQANGVLKRVVRFLLRQIP